MGSRQRGVTLGGRLRVHRSQRLALRVTVTSATRPNYHGHLPKLAHVDVIRGAVTGPTTAKDTWKAPDTRVVEPGGPVPLRPRAWQRRPAERTGYLGNRIDPAGPIQQPDNDGDPWLYTNPIFVDVVQ